MAMERYREASKRAVKFLAGEIQPNGQFRDPKIKDDLGAIYKAPTQLLLEGYAGEAKRMLDFIKERFLQPNGDFLSHPEIKGWKGKTDDWHISYLWGYTNGWIAMAAQRAGRYDIAIPAINYMRTFYNPVQKAFTWYEPYRSDGGGKGLEQTLCSFYAAHVGFIMLFFGDISTAVECGNFIKKVVDLQPRMDDEFFLKIRGDTGELFIDGIPDDKRDFFTCKRNAPNQRYYHLGYPVMFLVKLYLATQDEKYMVTARTILEFTVSCGAPVYTYNKSHKVMYGAALFAAVTKEKAYKELAEKIAENMLSYQDEEGRFLPESTIIETYDQTAENCGWFREIFAEFQNF
ncbi:hypothetical protein SNE40_008579 [Patella caerulea]|uniref:Uncharacterized protein n=1 Tax=Patella caerulea TaxID=87958 RepID=A0AAN8K0C5_PATCE